MKPRILYIITQDTWGGAQRYVFDLATTLSKEFDISIAIGNSEEPFGLGEQIHSYTEKNPGTHIEIIKLHHLKRKISPISDICAIKEIKNLYQKQQPHLVHLNSSKAGVIGSLAARGLHIPIIYTVHGWAFKEHISRIQKWIYAYSEKLTAQTKSKLIVLSEEEKNDAITILNIPTKKLEVIPLGISQEKFHTQTEARKILGIENSSAIIHIGVIANFFPAKGIDTLLNALYILSKNKFSISYRLHSIGDGPLRNQLETNIKKYNLQKIVTLHGFIPDAEKLISAFDLCIIPSHKEGLPYTLIQCMKSGVPVITTNVGGIPSFAKENRGNITLVHPSNASELAQAIQNGLTHLSLEDKDEKKGALLPIQYTLGHMVEHTKKLYEELIPKVR